MPVSIALNRNKETVVSEQDADLAAPAQRWYCHRDGYVCRSIHRKTVFLHRVVMERILQDLEGRPLHTYERVAHRDGDLLNNQRENLRLQAKQLQHKLPGTLRPTNTSGYTGVSLANNGRWRAFIRWGGKNRYLGTYKTREEAACAYREVKARKAGGEQIRFPYKS